MRTALSPRFPREINGKSRHAIRDRSRRDRGRFHPGARCRRHSHARRRGSRCDAAPGCPTADLNRFLTQARRHRLAPRRSRLRSINLRGARTACPDSISRFQRPSSAQCAKCRPFRSAFTSRGPFLSHQRKGCTPGKSAEPTVKIFEQLLHASRGHCA